MTEPKAILLVEDNDADVELAREALREVGRESRLAVARDGEEALRYVFGDGGGADGRLPSLVLLDLGLPGIGGLEVLKRLRADERTKLLPVVVLTNSNDEIDGVESYKLGCNSYLRKPSNFGEFIKSIGELTTYWLERNRIPKG